MPEAQAGVVVKLPVNSWAQRRLACWHKRERLIAQRDRLIRRIDALTYMIEKIYSPEAERRSAEFWEQMRERT